jgi:hypothetical protein
MPNEALLERAISYLDEHGSATPTDLARHVFGGEAFTPMLESLQDERLSFDGRVWRLRQPAEDWATLDILSSGPNPRRHRIVELAAKRGQDRFEALIWSPKRVPELLRRVGVPERPDEPDSEWLALDCAVQELRSFLAGATVVAFGCVPAFLDQLLGPRWPAIDLLRLVQASGFAAGALGEGTTSGTLLRNRPPCRPDPMRLAQRFGLAPPTGRRPGRMLAFSEALFHHLRNGRSLDELRDAARPRPAALPVCPDVPSGPGVYVMAGDDGQALYVGKSVELKRRVSSYLRSPITLTRNMHDLMQLTARIEAVAVSGELEALMMENALIQEWLPPFNIQRKAGDRCRYIRLSTQEAFPKLTLRAAPAGDGAAYFGPFRNATAAARLRLLLGSILRLRTCTRQLPARGKPRPACPKAAAGECLAPCIPGPPPAPYGAEVDLAWRLLTASAEDFRRTLRQVLRNVGPTRALKLKQQLAAVASIPSPTRGEGLG